MGLFNSLFGCKPKTEEKPKRNRLEFQMCTITKVEYGHERALVTLTFQHGDVKQAIYNDTDDVWYWYPDFSQVRSQTFVGVMPSIPCTPTYYMVLSRLVNRIRIEGLDQVVRSYA